MTDRLANARDVGGIPVPGTGTIREGVLLRSDAPYEEDVPVLADALWPPGAVVDLRSPAERHETHPLASGTTVVEETPMTWKLDSGVSFTGVNGGPANMAESYLGLISGGGGSVVKVAELIVAGHGPVLVHCVAGKDRTGIAVATLLLAVGADRDAVIADYLASGPAMDGVWARIRSHLPLEIRGKVEDRIRRRPDLLQVHEDAMRQALDSLDQRSGPAEWLLENGLTEEALNTVKDRLVEPGNEG